MTSIKNVPISGEKDLTKINLHTVESMVNLQEEIPKQIKQDEVCSKRNVVFAYMGNKARSIRAEIPPINVEIIMFLYMFSYVMQSITSVTMIMNKVCIVHLGYSENVCRNISEYPLIKSEVEKMTNNYHLGHTLLQLIPSAFLAIFIGPWSDKYSRKLPILLSLIGIILNASGTTMCAYYFYSRVEYYYIPALFTCSGGGFIGVHMVLYSYVSDITTSATRTMKFALMEMAFGLSMPLGSLAGGWIFKFYGYVPVFLTSTCGHILGLTCAIFLMNESRGLDNKDNWITKFKNFWSFESVISSFRTVMKKRPNRGREQLWLLILGMSIAFFSFASVTGIAFLYVHHLYNWENTTYSTWTAIYQVTGLTMMLIIVPLSKKWNIRDPVLGVVGSLSLLVKTIATGLAYQTWIYHLANFAGLLSSLGTLAGRSKISKVVPKDDLGKVFSFLMTAESLLPIVSTAIVSQAFNATLDFFPGLIFLIMGTLIIIPLIVFIWISRLPILNYDKMTQETPEKT